MRTVALALFAASALAVTPATAAPKKRATRWYGADPHVPLAAVNAAAPDRARIIESAGVTGDVAGPAARKAQARAAKAACDSWAEVGKAFDAIDRWGQSLGTRKMKNRDFYDVTGCFETYFPDDRAPHHPPFEASRPVLYVSGDFTPRPSPEWKPADAVRKDHAAFVARLTAAIVDPESRCKPDAKPADGMLPLASRTMFFVVHEPADTQNERPARDHHYAASGGCAMIIAERAASGWFAAYADASLANERWANNGAYLPVAVVDMNGDGSPEVVVHESEGAGEFYGDTVISRGHNAEWRLVARSVGGSTA